MCKDIEENQSSCKVREGVTSPVKLGGSYLPHNEVIVLLIGEVVMAWMSTPDHNGDLYGRKHVFNRN